MSGRARPARQAAENATQPMKAASQTIAKEVAANPGTGFAIFQYGGLTLRSFGADGRSDLKKDRSEAAADRSEVATDRSEAAADRSKAATDRSEAATDRSDLGKNRSFYRKLRLNVRL